MPIGDDFAIDYATKRIYHVTGTTVYTVNALYSWLMDTFDEQGAMDDEIPMSAQTPNAYTMINNWFIDDESTHYLKDGAITQTRDDANIALLTFQAEGYTSCVSSDITKQVVWDGTNHGPLLAYNNTTRKWWVRTGDSFTPSKSISIENGTGAGTAIAFDNTGHDLFANLYTLGTIEENTDIYIYQAGAKIVPDWWGIGHIDILIKVREFGDWIDGGTVTVYARMYTDLYDFYEIDLSAGGRNAVPLATADDLDNPTAPKTVLNYLSTIKLMFVNGELPFSEKTGDNPVAHMVLHGQTSHATAFILDAPETTSGTLTLGSTIGTFSSGETVELCEELRFDDQKQLFEDGSSISSSSGGTGFIRRVIQDPQQQGNEGRLFLSNVTGSWNDNDALLVDGSTFAYQNGPLITNTFQATAGTLSFRCTTSKDLDNGNGLQPYNIVIDNGGFEVQKLYEFVKVICRSSSTIKFYPTNGTDTVFVYNGEFYQKANTTYLQLKKASPLGTFAGGKFFGARGIWIENVASSDAEKFSLIDANNVTQNPPVSSVIRVVSMIASTDRVLVCESTGSGSRLPKKDQYTMATQSAGVNYVQVTTSITDDAPKTGVVRVVYNYGQASEAEDIYSYTSIDKVNNRFMITGTTARAYSSNDRAYNPFIDAFADSQGNAEVIVKYSGTVKYIVARVRKAGYIPYELPTSFGAGITTITAVRTLDGIYTP